MTDPGLTAELLIQGYASGVFPMADSRDSDEIYWVNPRKRGILPLNGFIISRSLAKRMRKGGYKVTLNDAFAEVVEACADREETWINGTIYDLYLQLHEAGHAQSLEIWHEDTLTGGVYGVTLGAVFFGESMFSRRTDASKIALAYLVDHLNRCDFQLFDTQFITPHLASLGAVEVSRKAYHARLRAALQQPADFYSVTEVPSASDVLQRNTQTS